MDLFLKVTTITLLLVLTLHPGHLQDVSDSTDTPNPAKTIDKTWLRRPKIQLREIKEPSPAELPPGEQNPSSPEEQDPSSTGEQGQFSGGIPSGYMETEDMTLDPMEESSESSTIPNETPSASENQNENVSTATPQMNSDVSVTTADTGNNETSSENTEDILQNSTNASNDVEVQTPTPFSDKNSTDVKDYDSGEANDTETHVTTTTQTPVLEASTQQAATPETTTLFVDVTAKTTTLSSPATPETTPSAHVAPDTSTTSAPVTPDRTNLSDKGAPVSGGTAERGFGSESEKQKRKSAWGAVLGTFVAIAVVGLVAYVILKKKHHKAFSHRKLEEDFPSDPVLRLDNSEPLDLNFGRAAYYNPALQGDNIQMSPFPKN